MHKNVRIILLITLINTIYVSEDPTYFAYFYNISMKLLLTGVIIESKIKPCLPYSR